MPPTFLHGIMTGVVLGLIGIVLPIAYAKLLKTNFTLALTYISEQLGHRESLFVRLFCMAMLSLVCNTIGERTYLFAPLCAMCGVAVCGIKLTSYHDRTGLTKGVLMHFYQILLCLVWAKRGCYQSLAAFFTALLALIPFFSFLILFFLL